MILYLIRKYALLYVLIVLMMTFIGMAGRIPLDVALPKAALYSGFFAAGMTWFEIRRKGLWPLYDNLRIPRKLLFGGLVASAVAAYVVLGMVL